MSGDDAVSGDEVLVSGMTLSVRLRRDFTVTDAAGLLAAARRAYLELHPGASAEEADVMVVCAADGMAVGGWRAEVVINEPHPLSPEPRRDCLRGDVFALPADDTGD